jgi:hypothetical protein
VPESERQFVRDKCLEVLMEDPSDRVAIQSGLLIANICRFDFPDAWKDVLEVLYYKGSGQNHLIPLERQYRPLKAIKYIIQALQTKRFVINESRNAPLMSLTTERLQVLGQNLENARLELKHSLQQLLGPLRNVWEIHYRSFSNNQSLYRLQNLKICTVAMSCCREVLLMLNSITAETKDQFTDCMESACSIAGEVGTALFGQFSGLVSEDDIKCLSKCWEQVLQIGIVGMDKHPVLFSPSLSQWMSLCIHTAILQVDAKTIHTIRPKSRVLVTKFLARALLQPLYRKGGPHIGISGFLQYQPIRNEFKDNSSLADARNYIERMFSLDNGNCKELVEAIVHKYIVISPDEILEWEMNPEEFAREVDVETSPDADTPRACGIALIECMFDYSGEPTRNALLSLATYIIQSRSSADESIIVLEAIYRTMGECFQHLKGDISFDNLYQNELRSIFASPSARLSRFGDSVLKSRAIWLIGVCANELSPAFWPEAFGICVSHILKIDVVVSLMAISSATAMISLVIEEQEFISQPRDHKILLLEGPLTSFDGNELVEEASKEFEVHIQAILSHLDALLDACFKILPQLSEIESMIQVLQCVTACVELAGSNIISHFNSFSNFLQPLWFIIMEQFSSKSSVYVRLQSAILAMLGHLVSKLGRVAAEDAKIAGVVFPLLISATDPSNPSIETLAEDALRLWLAVLRASPSLTLDLQELGPRRLVPHLERGKELDFVLQIAASYALHGGIGMVDSMLDLLSLRCTQVIDATIKHLRSQPGNHEREGKSRLSAKGIVEVQVARELESALQLISILQRLYNSPPPVLKDPIKAACSLLSMQFIPGSGQAISSSSLPVRLTSLLHPALQIICRLIFTSPDAFNELTDGDFTSQSRLLDRWGVLCSLTDAGELFVPALAAIGRARRHNAAVALCYLILSDSCQILRDAPRMARLLIVILRAANEQAAFDRDQQSLWDQQDTSTKQSPESLDFIMEKKLTMSRQDPLRAIDAKDAARMAANHVCSWLGKEKLLALLEDCDPVYRVEMESLLSSQLPQNETEEAIRSMQQAHI